MSAQLSVTTRLVSCSPRRSAAGGFTLIEVLVALVVMSVGLLGLAALQQNAVTFNRDAYLASQATLLAYDMADRIRGNRQAGRDGDYDSAFAGTPPACNSAVAAGTVVTEDIGAWRRALSCALPMGNGQIAYDDVAQTLTITVTWDPSRGTDPQGDADETFTMTTGL